MKNLSNVYHNRYRNLSDARDLEKQMMGQELDITQRIRDITKIQKEKLRGELYDVKSILMVPRLHF